MEAFGPDLMDWFVMAHLVMISSADHILFYATWQGPVLPHLDPAVTLPVGARVVVWKVS